MKKSNGLLLKGEMMKKGLTIIKKIKTALMGKPFEPMPSYWALIPVKRENNLPGNIK